MWYVFVCGVNTIETNLVFFFMAFCYPVELISCNCVSLLCVV